MAVTSNYLDPNIGRKNTIQNEHLKRAPKLPGGQPIFSHIEFSICGLCNRTCEFCPRADPKIYPNKKEYMPIELYKKILYELKEVNYDGRLSFSGFSEPMLHKEVFELVRLTKEILPTSIIEIITIVFRSPRLCPIGLAT